MRSIDLIVIHCTASLNGRWTTVADIDAWHRARDFKRAAEARRAFNPTLAAIGYHFVIYTNGAIATGRGLDEIGAHAEGYNQRSAGIALVGTDRFTAAQWRSLAELVRALTQGANGKPASCPDARVCGHRDLPKVAKACPGFEVSTWRRGGMEAPADILPE